MNRTNGLGALIICINYGASDTTAEFLRSFGRLQLFENISVIIGDNSSRDDHLVSIRRAISVFSNVELLESPTNRGYFGAARFAFDHYLAKGQGLPDWVIVCNNDVLIEDSEFLTKLFALDPKAVAVIAPRIQVMPGRVDQNPFMRRRPGRLRWASFRLSFSSYGIAALWDWVSRQKQGLKAFWQARRSGSPSMQTGEREFIYAPHGAFFIFSRRYFEAGGYLDGNLFLYGEEFSVAEICRSLGLPVIYEPSLCVLHQEHRSTGKRINRFSYECQKKALRYITSHYLHAGVDTAS
jgi:GT2 family glycosyltransferase